MAYFANSSEGEAFDRQCGLCEFGELSCPIALAQQTYNYSFSLAEDGRHLLDSLVSNKDGCQMYKLIRAKRGENKDLTIKKLQARVDELEAGQGELFKE